MITNKLIVEIKSKINDNQKQGITGGILQGVLLDMVESLSEAYPQIYTEEQKAQARANIDALSNYDGAITKEKLSIEVQAILNDVANKQNITDESLATIAKTIVGAINEVYKGGLKDASIATSKIEDRAITDAKIASGVVTTTKIANDAVTTEKVNDGAITKPKLDTDLVNVITSAVQPAELASAIATALASYVAKADIVATTGSATDKVMSQHGVTEAINGVTNKVTELEKEMPLKDTEEDGFAICNENGEAIARYDGDKWKFGVIESESIDEAKSIATIEEDGFAICNEKGEAIARYVGDKWELSGSAVGKSQNGTVSISHLDMNARDKVILLGSNSVQNHKSMAFSGIINGAFNGISLGHGYKGYFLASWIDVTSTDIVVHNFTSTEDVYTYPHGLTIENNIQVIITIGYKDKKIKVVSNGNSFEQDISGKYMGAALNVWVKSSTELKDCSMSWACPKLQNGVWVFGDSFYTLGDTKRWPTYLFDDGFTNSIVVARSGETDFGGLTSLNTLLKVATPRCIVWGLGMNDHDISATEYNVNWKNVIDRVIAICKENGIDLILATIPSAKQDSATEGAAAGDAIHEAKNTYIRTSGIRYIDFAKAVGATSEGVWFDGMKEDTGVHPTEKGARALYMQAVADTPEILI